VEDWLAGVWVPAIGWWEGGLGPGCRAHPRKVSTFPACSVQPGKVSQRRKEVVTTPSGQSLTR
jgi:hypothetical protein